MFVAEKCRDCINLKKERIKCCTNYACVCVLTILVVSTKHCVNSHKFIQCEKTVPVQFPHAAHTAGDRVPSIRWVVCFTQTPTVADPAGGKIVCCEAYRVQINTGC